MQVDVDKPLIDTVLIGRFEQAVTYEGINRLCFSCGRMDHRRECCPYAVKDGKDQVEKEEGDSVDRVGQPCNTYAIDIPEWERRTTSEALEDNYGPWLLVSRKRNGTKGHGGNMVETGRVLAQEQREWDMQDLAAKAGTSNASKSGSHYSMHEGKRKFSPLKPHTDHLIKEGDQGGIGETPLSGHGPSPSSPIGKYHPGLGKGPVNSKLTFSASVKGKKGIARSKEHQTSFRILERPNAIPFLQSNNRLSSSFHRKPVIDDETDIGYQFKGVKLSNTNSGNGKGVESDLSAIGEERLGKNVKPESAERTSLHVGVSGYSRIDASGVRDKKE